MAGETGTSGATGAEFPVFKSSAGAFDRAKYEEQDKARIVSDGVNARATGKEIDEDLVEKKKSVDKVAKEAINFYNESYSKNIKEIDPAIDTNTVYYREAYSGVDSDKNKIKRKLDKGETIDGKEIFEMSKKAAKKKIGNALVLKNSKVTEIIENLGLKTIKDFDLYEDVKSDFNSKIKDEKLKFETILDKLSPLLSYFNDDGPTASQNYSKLYTTENKAILAALAKILEAEGFDNDGIKKASESYDKNMSNLIEKDNAGSIDDIKMDKDGNIVSSTGGTGATGTTAEQKLEEKKTKSPTGPTPTARETGSTASAGSTGTIEGSSTETKKTEVSSTGPSSTTSTEKLESVNKNSTGTTGTTGAVGTNGAPNPGKIEDVKTGDNNKGATGSGLSELSQSAKGILEMLGIKAPASKEGEGGTGGTGETGGDEGTTGNPKADKILDELGIKKTKDSEGEEKTKNKAKTENKETKLEEKISGNMNTKPETSVVNTPIKETVTQNLSSVTTPSAETKVEKKEEIKTTPTTTTENKTGDIKSETSSGVKTIESQQKESEDKTKKDDQDKMNKELGDNMKSMVALLTQLNNTMKNPLMVISNDKKFH